MEKKPHPQKMKGQICHFPTLDFNGREGGGGESILSIFIGTFLLKKNTYQNKTKQFPTW